MLYLQNLFLFQITSRPLPYVPSWIVIFLFIQTILLLYLYLYSPKLLWMPLRALIDHRIRRELLESKKSFQYRLLYLLDLVFLISLSFLLYFLMRDKPSTTEVLSALPFLFNKPEITLYFFILGASALGLIIKKQIFIGIAQLFDEMQRYYIFIFNMDMLQKFFGLITFPVIFAYSFDIIQSPFILNFIMTLNIIIYLLFLILSFASVAHKVWIDYINFILYLCALEIIPLLFFLKLLFN